MNIAPVTACGDGEGLEVGLDLVVQVVAPLSQSFGVVMIPGVADPLEEQHGEHVGLEVARVDGAAQRVRGVP